MSLLSIGIDIGTTSTKAVLFDESGTVRAKAQKAYPLMTPDIDTAEQNPSEMMEAVEATLKEIIAKSQKIGTLSHIAFSAQMHSILLVDEAMRPITHSITWADNRAKEVVLRLKNDEKGKRLYQNTGTPIHAMSPLCKLIWMKEARQALYAAAYKVMDIKTYIIYQLTQQCVMDMSIASATGLFNIHDKKWDDEALKLVGLNDSHLPEVVPTTHVLSFTNEVCQRFNLTHDIPVIIGASDGVLSNLGVDSYKQGEVAVTIGTSGAIRTVVKHPILDPKGRTFCYILDDTHYVIGGPVNNGAITFQWLRDHVFQMPNHHDSMMTFDEMMALAQKVNPGANGLLFHPYLSGERAPIWSSEVRGSFIGLTLAHHQGHMIRAVLEGVLFNLYSVLLVLVEMTGRRPHKIKATGGFSKSVLWRQLMADIFDCHVEIPKSYESSCLGAVALGFKALGHPKAYCHISEWIGRTYYHEPNEEVVLQYQKLSSIFVETRQQLMRTYKSIATYENEK
ncbi:gluconokinase [Staphylococcus ratti]|uniref:Gluconokinase n=1 Tax=Staphylococcus ratti TaxID=2892440 RepID=A0ABY3PEY8_9STAP|nr:gluconokinase [Staphylococcus ratti]UEX90763.1 gluconokinase [Staphylococcus ratti]